MWGKGGEEGDGDFEGVLVGLVPDAADVEDDPVLAVHDVLQTINTFRPRPKRSSMPM